MKKGDFPYRKEAEKFIRNNYINGGIQHNLNRRVCMPADAIRSGRKIGIFRNWLSLLDYFILCAKQAENLSDEELITYAFCSKLTMPPKCHAWRAIEFVLHIRGIKLQPVNDQQNPAPFQTSDPIGTDVS
jgi:hypothetical protein